MCGVVARHPGVELADQGSNHGSQKKKDPSTMEIFRGINSAGTSWVASGPFLNPAAQENFFLLQYLGGGPP